MATVYEVFSEKAKAIPPPGKGCHPALLGVANTGCNLGLSDSDIFRGIKENVPVGDREVPDTEIWLAINRARSDEGNKSGTAGNAQEPLPPLSASIADITAMSPIKPFKEHLDQTMQVLNTLYVPSDLIFIGSKYTTVQTVLSVEEHIANLLKGIEPEEQIIANPLSGKEEPKKDGSGMTLRGDRCVAKHKFLLIEFDGLSQEEQCGFWVTALASGLPVSALLLSGGKSVHGWLRVDATGSSDWDRRVRPLLTDFFVVFGADSACGNPSRLSRTPGALRTDKQRRQELLYLSVGV